MCSLAIALALGVVGISVLDTLLLRPVAAADPGRLVRVHTSSPEESIDGVSYPDLQYYSANNHVFTGVTGVPAWISVRELSIEELGIRVALGARPWHLLRMVFRQVWLTAGAGILIGSLFGIGTTTLVGSWFYQVGIFEWYVLFPVGFSMMALSMLIAWLAARRWIHADPMEAVRHN